MVVPAPKVVWLTGCITIETGDDPSNLLPDTRSLYGGANPHTGTAEAITYLKKCPSGERVIVGHGMPGILLTKYGDRGGDLPDDYIDINTDLSGLQGIATLRLVGCRVGADDDGKDLVNAIASRLKCQVFAPTGEVYCGKQNGKTTLYLQDGTDWLAASSTDPAEKVDSPTWAAFAASTKLRLQSDKPEEVDVLRNQISAIEFSASGAAPRTLDGHQIDTLFACTDFEHPMRPGAPAAIANGTLTFTFTSDAPVTRPRSMIIYNDNLMMDREYPDVLYRFRLKPVLNAL